MLCSNCKKNEVIEGRDLCMSCVLNSLAQAVSPDKYFCPKCKRETKTVFEYSTEEFDHRKTVLSASETVFNDYDILKEYFTCLECGKQFVVTTEEERK